MNRIRKPLFAGIALALLSAGALVAQDNPCKPEQKWIDCQTNLFNRIDTLGDSLVEVQKEANNPEKKKESKGAVGDLIGKALVGAATGSEVNLEDFLSSLLTTLDVDGLEDADGGFKFKKNFPVGGGTLAVEMNAKKGELFPELKMKLESDEQKDLIETLDGELEDFDDLSLNVKFSIDRSGDGKKIWWGRKYRSGGVKTGNGDVATKLYELVVDDLEIRKASLADREKTMDEALDELNEALGKWPLEDKTPNAERTVKATPPSILPEINAALEKFAKAEEADFKSFSEALTWARYFAFGKLVANQPQFVLSAGHAWRDELVGRDSWTAGVKYEVGQANVNGLRKQDCWKTPDLDCYKGFIAEQDGALKKNWRVALNGSYTWTDDYDYTSPDGAVTLMLDESEAWDASLSAGRTLRFTKDPDDPDKQLELTRFDLEAAYQDVTGDTEKQGRFVSTATFTQRITDQLSLAVGVIYANRPEYRGEVDEEFSARAGLKVSLKQKDKKKGK